MPSDTFFLTFLRTLVLAFAIGCPVCPGRTGNPFRW
jgi:hypothetical protein